MGFDFSKMSVLMIEDTAPMRQLLDSVLHTLGFGRIDSVGTAEEGLALFKEKNHDIIISDWHMEPMDGIQLTNEVRKGRKSPNRMVPIILITGYSSWSKVEEARDAGATEYLVKPFRAADLAKRIAHVITKPRDFIRCDAYFGPDRRRKKDFNYRGPFRRSTDEQQDEAAI